MGYYNPWYGQIGKYFLSLKLMTPFELIFDPQNLSFMAAERVLPGPLITQGGGGLIVVVNSHNFS